MCKLIIIFINLFHYSYKLLTASNTSFSLYLTRTHSNNREFQIQVVNSILRKNVVQRKVKTMGNYSILCVPGLTPVQTMEMLNRSKKNSSIVLSFGIQMA